MSQQREPDCGVGFTITLPGVKDAPQDDVAGAVSRQPEFNQRFIAAKQCDLGFVIPIPFGIPGILWSL